MYTGRNPKIIAGNFNAVDLGSRTTNTRGHILLEAFAKIWSWQTPEAVFGPSKYQGPYFARGVCEDVVLANTGSATTFRGTGSS